MKLPTAKIEACAAKNDIRAYLNAVHLEIDADGARLVATDGAGLVCVPVETEDGDAPGYVTPDAIKMARAIAGRNGEPRIACSGALKMTNGASLPRPDPADVGRYPDWRRIIPPCATERAPDLVIDAELLLRVARGLCDGTRPIVRIYLQRDGNGEIDASMPVVLEPGTGAEGAIGVVMPCRNQ